jgi:cytochrome P450
VVRDLSHPLPVIVISELLGLPREDRELLGDWADRLLSLPGADLRDGAARQRSADIQRSVLDYLRTQLRRRRAAPRDDVLGQLTCAEVDGRRLSEDEAVNFANLLLLAGHVTTTQLLANLVLSLDEHDLLPAVRADENLIPGAIEETLRYRPVISSNMRMTTQPVTIGGQAVPARQFVSLSFLSANRDERQFADPDRFDIHRRANHHLGFGHGIHYCLGAPLAHLEIRIALRALLRRFPAWNTAGPILYYEMPGVVGPRSLPVVFHRR